MMKSKVVLKKYSPAVEFTDKRRKTCTWLFGKYLCQLWPLSPMCLNYFFYSFFLFCLMVSPSSAQPNIVSISKFSEKSLNSWQQKKFKGETRYTFVVDEAKGWVLKAESAGSASGLFREITVNINETPFLNWSWKAEILPDVGDEKTKSGDDYAARVYVLFKSGYGFWNSKALNYVWNSHYPIGENWPNAFTSSAQLLVLQSGRDHVGKWIAEKRNVQKDIFDCFGIEVTDIEAVALMTDADNSGGRAVAYYGEIFFSRD